VFSSTVAAFVGITLWIAWAYIIKAYSPDDGIIIKVSVVHLQVGEEKMTLNQTPFFGNTSSGTLQGPGDGTGNVTVNQIIGYTNDNNSSYISGLDLYYTDSTHYLFGATTDFSGTYTFPGGVIDGAHYHVETGTLRGVKFKSTIGTNFVVGFFEWNKQGIW